MALMEYCVVSPGMPPRTELILISFQDDTNSDMLRACHDNAYPLR